MKLYERDYMVLNEEEQRQLSKAKKFFGTRKKVATAQLIFLSITI